MKKTTIKLYCDICDKEIESFCNSASERHSIVYTLRKYVYYGNTQDMEICDNCAIEISNFINHLTKRGKK